MASGDTLRDFDPRCHEPDTSNFPSRDTRNNHPVLDFALNKLTHFSFILPRSYSGGGITVYPHYSMTSATTNDIKLEISFERIGDGQQDVDTDGFATALNTGDITVPATSGHVDIINKAFTDGAQIDSIAVGELCRIKVKRIAVSTTDAAGDLELHRIELKET